VSVPIPTTEPTRIYSGLTTEWTRAFSDYAPGTYTLKYRFIGSSNIAVTATTSGSDFLVTITPAISELFIAGNYRLNGWVENGAGTEKRMVYEGDVEILYDPTTQAADAAGVETRSFWRQIRDNLQAIITGKSQQSSSSYQLAGRQVSRMTWAELMQAYNQAAEMVGQEEKKDSIRRGETTSNNIGIRFTRP
jgi:hypothetical protein